MILEFKVGALSGILCGCLLLLCGCGVLDGRRHARLAEARGSLMMAPKVAPRPVLPPPSFVKTPEVQAELVKLSGSHRAFIRSGMKRLTEFGATVRTILRDEGVPEEALGLAMIESGFDADARSPAGAAGMWQFMKETGRHYGLRIDFFEDQRQDPVLSTIAAARMLRDLFSHYKDWTLVFAAYNAGSGYINRQLARAGTRNYWELARGGFLHGETRNFVPRVLAAAMIMRNPSEYGFYS